MKTLKIAAIAVLLTVALAGCSKSDSSAEAVPESISQTKESHAPYTNITEATFAAFNDSADVTVVDFWATWCGPCRTMAPRFESAATELDGVAAFGKVDVDDNLELAKKFEIRSIPTILIFKNGELADQIVGLVSKEQLVAQVKKHI